jgi:hypothetical protein
MTKTELESKHLSDLHQLAADAGVERYRMLTRGELIERLSDGDDDDGGSGGDREGGERPRRRRRRSGSGSGSGAGSGSAASGREREARVDVEEEEEDESPAPKRSRPERSRRPARSDEKSASADEVAPSDENSTGDSADGGTDEASSRSRRPRRRRRRPFARRRDGVSIQDLLLPAESGRQAVLLAESREAATELLRGVAADLAGSDGPDPIALLIDPSPEELADWKREAPQAELVSAGQARHAADALTAAQRRAADGEDVILLIDSLTRFADGFGDTDGAKELFDAGRGDASGKGSLTVVVALERG